MAAAAQEEVADGADGGREDQAGAEPGEDADGEQEVPVRGAEAEQQRREHHADGAGQHEEPRPVGVEERADLQAAEEGEEDVEAEDPGRRAGAVGRELVRAQVRLEDADCVGNAVVSVVGRAGGMDGYVLLFMKPKLQNMPQKLPRTTSQARNPPSGYGSSSVSVSVLDRRGPGNGTSSCFSFGAVADRIERSDLASSSFRVSGPFSFSVSMLSMGDDVGVSAADARRAGFALWNDVE